MKTNNKEKSTRRLYGDEFVALLNELHAIDSYENAMLAIKRFSTLNGNFGDPSNPSSMFNLNALLTRLGVDLFNEENIKIIEKAVYEKSDELDPYYFRSSQKEVKKFSERSDRSFVNDELYILLDNLNALNDENELTLVEEFSAKDGNFGDLNQEESMNNFYHLLDLLGVDPRDEKNSEMIVYALSHNLDFDTDWIRGAQQKPIDRETLVEDTMNQLGMRHSLSGYNYFKEAVMFALDHEQFSIMNELYPMIAYKYNKTSTKVERAIANLLSNNICNIRQNHLRNNAINYIYNIGDRIYNDASRLTNAEAIHTVKVYVQQLENQNKKNIEKPRCLVRMK